VIHQVTDPAAARQLAVAAGGPDPVLPGPDPGSIRDPRSTPATAAADPSALRDGEFLLAVRNPPRLVHGERA
jgi:hypothetical protein